MRRTIVLYLTGQTKQRTSERFYVARVKPDLKTAVNLLHSAGCVCNALLVQYSAFQPNLNPVHCQRAVLNWVEVPTLSVSQCCTTVQEIQQKYSALSERGANTLSFRPNLSQTNCLPCFSIFYMLFFSLAHHHHHHFGFCADIHRYSMIFCELRRDIY